MSKSISQEEAVDNVINQLKETVLETIDKRPADVAKLNWAGEVWCNALLEDNELARRVGFEAFIGIMNDLGYGLQIVRLEEQPSVDLPAVNVYTDGSYHRVSQMCGWGFVVKDTSGGLIHSEYGATDRDVAAEHWNIAGECEAVINALLWLSNNGYEFATIYHDYEGLGCWARGEWKAKKPFTQNYAKFVQEKITEMKALKFEWVRGHSGCTGNDMAHDLAQRAVTEGRK